MLRDQLRNKSICILYGGWSDEREISLQSGSSVFKTLKDEGYNVYKLDLKKNEQDLIDYIKKYSIDLVFNLIHGIGGEDGLVQSWLEEMNIDYVGSNSNASRISFSKVDTKEIWLKNKLLTPNYIKPQDLTFFAQEYFNKSKEKSSKSSMICHDFFKSHKKFVIKPNCSGSSVGIKIYDDIDRLLQNHKELLLNNSGYFIESFVDADEYTAPIINGQVFPIIKIDTKREFYNYEAKYIDDDTSFTFPKFSESKLLKLEKICMDAFNILGCKGCGRVDFFLNNNVIHLIEINTIPGMTSHSLVPMSADKKGITYLELVEDLLSNV